MLQFFADYLNNLEELHHDIDQAIDGLSQDALDWSPSPEMNSVGVLVAHVAGSERYWLGEVVGQDPAHRNREAEFQTRGVDTATLQKRLAEALAHSKSVVEQLSLAHLTEARGSVLRDDITAGWALAHSLAHTAAHLGHIQITRQFYEMRE